MNLSNSQILEVLKEAKENYICGIDYDGIIYYSVGMCYCIDAVFYRHKYYIMSYDKIKEVIPEFCPEFFNTQENEQCYWWDIFDKESRNKAFDKLISIYDAKQWITYRY